MSYGNARTRWSGADWRCRARALSRRGRRGIEVVTGPNDGMCGDAGSVTAKNAEGSSVTTNKNGTTNANGVVVDPKKGTVTVPGVGTFATPPGAQ